MMTWHNILRKHQEKAETPEKSITKTSAFSGFSANTNSQCSQDNYMGMTIEELKLIAGNDWLDIKNNEAAIKAFAHAEHTRQQIQNGTVPSFYTKQAYCDSCGPVMLWPESFDHVQGCPWCLTNNKPNFSTN